MSTDTAEVSPRRGRRSVPKLDLKGRVIAGRYRICAELGRGGLGTVFEAVDETAQESGSGVGTERAHIALKLLNGEALRVINVKERFEREAVLQSNLNHPGIVKVHDSGVDSELGPFIVFELIRGESLAAKIAREGRLEPTVVVQVLVQLCAALRHAHEAGVIHRDISPGNVLVCSEATTNARLTVKLADFGLAFRDDNSKRLTRTSELIGATSYSSPEQLVNGVSDERSDVYALGMVAFHMLVGEPAFVAVHSSQLIYLHMHEPLPKLAERVQGVSPMFASVIERMVEKQPADRYRSVDEISNDLVCCKEWSAGQSGAGGSASPVLAVSALKSKWLAAAALGGGAGLGVALGWPRALAELVATLWGH